MFLLEGIAAVIAKIASASTVAQVATGIGITVAGVTGAGAVGALPGPVQSAVDSVSPFSGEQSADDRGTEADENEADENEAAETEADEAEDAETEDADDDSGASPTDIPGVQTTVPTTTSVPTRSHENEVEDEHGVEVEVEHHGAEDGDDDSEGIHQHRGGRTEATVDNSGPGSVNSGRDSTRTTSASRTHESEVEDEDENEDEDDDGGHHGGRSDSDDDQDDDDSGRHGGDDD